MVTGVVTMLTGVVTCMVTWMATGECYRGNRGFFIRVTEGGYHGNDHNKRGGYHGKRGWLPW